MRTFQIGSPVHYVGEREQSRRNVDAERFSRLQVDDEFELARLHDRQVGRSLAFEDAAGIDAELVILLKGRSIAHQPARFGIVAIGKNRGYRVARCKGQELGTTVAEKRE